MSTHSSSREPRVSRALIAVVLAAVLLAAVALGLSGSRTSASAWLEGVLPAGTQAFTVADDGVAAVAPAPARQRGKRYQLKIGISPGFSILDVTGARLDTDLDRAKALGAKQLRLDISWDQIEPQPGVFLWEKTDALFEATRAKNIGILAVIGFAPKWGEYASGAVQPDKFATFVNLAAKRYGSQVAAWEIWNEPNQTRSWIAKPNPKAYARMVNKAAPKIRRHDPEAKILMGSLAPAVDAPDGSEISPITFLTGIYRGGIKHSLYDSFSIHPFSYPAFPSGDESWNTFNRLPDIRRVMELFGDRSKSMWLTEYGARTGSTSRSVSLKRQKKLLLDAYRETKRLPYVEMLFFYSLRDYSADRRDSEANFGLLKYGGTPKPAYQALRRELRRN